jgi:hypothetical protein
MLRADRLTAAIRGRRPATALASAALASAALVLAGAGTAGAVTDASPAPAPPPAAVTAAPAWTAQAWTAAAPAAAAPVRTAAAPAGAAPAGNARPGAARPGAAPSARARTAMDRTEPARTATARAGHGIRPAADQLLPVGTAGPQSFMPIGAAQYANATTIVRQALARKMGVRSAVIAVATAMQESRLQDLDYGTGDSLGLFQQQYDMGWGTARQILNPVYASDKFLTALRAYQAGDPTWASQPLYQCAQGVQRSGFPYAYAQWETQAARLTAAIAHQVR